MHHNQSNDLNTHLERKALVGLRLCCVSLFPSLTPLSLLVLSLSFLLSLARCLSLPPSLSPSPSLSVTQHVSLYHSLLVTLFVTLRCSLPLSLSPSRCLSSRISVSLLAKYLRLTNCEGTQAGWCHICQTARSIFDIRTVDL